MSEVNEALADVKQEGSDPFADMGEKTSTESPTETKQEEVKPEEGKNTPVEENVPFHQHPRWIERENELKALKEKESEKDKAISELMEFKEQVTKDRQSSNSDIPKWFSTLYGDNAEAWSQYKEYDKTLREEIKREVIDTQIQERQQKEQEVKHWDNWVNGEIAKLEAQGKKFERNELIKVMLEYRPSDANNNFDFEAGYKILEATKMKNTSSEGSQIRKQIADTVNKSSRSESKPKTYLTAAELRKTSWQNL